MTKKYHSVLRRQLKRCRDEDTGEIDIDDLLDFVDTTYQENDKERRMSATSMALMSEELTASNRTLMDQNATLEGAIDAAEAANKAKTEFLANISHELRTPMHAIMNFNSMCKRRLGDDADPKVLRFLNRIEQSSSRLMRLLNDLLDLSKMEAGHMEFAFGQDDITEALKQVNNEIQSLLSAKSIELVIDNQLSDNHLIMDSYRIIQVLMNILSNAIKFSPEEKTITVRLQDKVLADNAPGICVEIIDQGMGIPPDELEDVFNKFIQSSKSNTGAGGTGLGLAICKEIIDSHGGYILAKNNDDEGCTFEFAVPREPHEAIEKQKAKADDASPDPDNPESSEAA